MWKKIKFGMLLALGIFGISPSLNAKEWDPSLLNASRLAYEGKIAEAEAMIDDYIQAHLEDPNGLMIKASVLDWKVTLTGQKPQPAQAAILDLYKKANDLAFHLWEDDPKNVDRLIDLGNSYLFLGRKYSDQGSWFKAVLTSKKCQKHLETAQELDPNRVDGLLALGGFHYLADNTPKSAAVFKKLLGIKGTKAQGLAELKKALTVEHPYYFDTQYALMFLYTNFEKNYVEALKLIDQLEREFPQNPEIPFRRAKVLEAQDKAKGLPAYMKVVEWCQTSGHTCHPNYFFLSYYNAGQLAKELGQNTQSREYLLLAQKSDPKLDDELSARTWWLLGQMDESEKKFKQALENFHQATQTPRISKDLKKDIEKNIQTLCKTENITEGC